MARAGTIDKATMRDFDETCLAITPAIAPAAIKQLRETNKVSQPVFARPAGWFAHERAEVVRLKVGGQQSTAQDAQILPFPPADRR